MQKRYEQACPVARTLYLVGDRWTMLIIRDLFLGLRRFNEILGSSAGMPPKLLSQRLKFLGPTSWWGIRREAYMYVLMLDCTPMMSPAYSC